MKSRFTARVDLDLHRAWDGEMAHRCHAVRLDFPRTSHATLHGGAALLLADLAPTRPDQ